MKKTLFTLITLFSFCSSLMAIVIPSPDLKQTKYRWRNDDGSETSATWRAPENTLTNVTSIDENLRLRLEIQNATVEILGIGTISQTLHYSKDGGTVWTPISNDATKDFILSPSTGVTHGVFTSNQMSAGTAGSFFVGYVISNTVPTVSLDLLGSQKTEMEWVIKPTSHMEGTATYLFRSNSMTTHNPLTYAVLQTSCVAEILSTEDGTICANGSVILNATASSGSEINWYASTEGGEIIGTGASFETPYLESTTTFYVEANADACVSERVPVIANIIIHDLTTIGGRRCDEGIVNLFASAEPAHDIEWYEDEDLTVLIGTGNSFTTPSISNTTTYYAVANTGSCLSIPQPVIAEVYYSPDVDVTPAMDTVCFGSPATFQATEDPNYDYLWSNGSTESALTTNVPGDHTVVVTNPDGCSTEVSVYLDTFVSIYVGGFDYVPSIFSNPYIISFTPISPIAVTNFFWDFGDGTTSEVATPVHEYDALGKYTVTLTVANDCDTMITTLDIFVKEENTSITDEALNKLISLYPNPANSTVTVKLDNGNTLSNISIFNQLGQKMETIYTNQETTYTIPLDEYAPGLYMIKIESDKGKFALKKLIIAK